MNTWGYVLLFAYGVIAGCGGSSLLRSILANRRELEDLRIKRLVRETLREEGKLR